MNSDNDSPKIGIALEQIHLEDILLGNDPDFNALQILPTRNVVLFPDVTISISLRRESSVKIVQKAYDKHLPLGVVCQIDPDEDSPTLFKGLYKVGVIADVLKILELPDGEKTALLRGRDPFKILGSAQKTKRAGAPLIARAQLLEDVLPSEKDRSFGTILKNIRKLLAKIMPAYSEGFVHMINNLSNDDDPVSMINMLATNLPIETEDKQNMLQARKVKERAMILLRVLSDKEQEIDLNMDIMSKVKVQMDDDQKRMILQKQMDVIHEQLYGETDDTEKLRLKASELQMSPEACETFAREIAKLDHLSPNNPDYYVIYNYLDLLLSLPWGKETEINYDLGKAQLLLDKEHCGLEKVKERIMEQLAVLKRKPDVKSPILCLVGPPGVGKTSLGKSIAEAMGRQYQRVSLGGLHDEAEIRGHRRTYIGAMPGRVIDAVKRAGVSNPVIVLDEVDKLGNDYKGDPSAALLEVLDPEQNSHFHDNYVDVDFDLSHILFLATANTLATVPKPLLDRMETINIPGYLSEEKLDIARKHLLRRILSNLSIEENEFSISDDAINAIIDIYTNESGVRQLEKTLSSLARKYVLARECGKDFPVIIEPAHLKELLGLPPFTKEKYEDNSLAGVVTGLAWTEAGGEILLAEASLVPGKGTETVTGNLGNVMKESATIAYQWVKAHASQVGIDTSLFDKYNLHIHFPEGAVPKDGPSAGITIATAIVSAFKQKRVREKIAMTGEITLRGRVLPVGGIKEKILAAKRAGISDIVLPDENRKDIEDIDSRYTVGMSFHYARTALEVMNYAITEEDVAEPLSL